MKNQDIPPYMKNDRFAKLTGIETIIDEEGRPSAILTIAEKHLNGLQTAQGGSIFTLADHAFALASNTDGRISVALNLSVNFINAARLGDTLRTKARELSRRRVISIYEITVLNQEDQLIATFTATAYKIGEQETISD